MFVGTIPDGATGLQLCRIDRKEQLHTCEAVFFPRGKSAVATTLNRASISGRVEIGPPSALPDHFVDILDEQGDILETAALDVASFKILKTKWMRCKYERFV